MIASASRGSAPPFSVDCSRKRSAISATVRPPTLVVPAIDIRSVTSASAALRSEPARAASTPSYSLRPGAVASVSRSISSVRLTLRLKSLISRRRQTG